MAQHASPPRSPSGHQSRCATDVICPDTHCCVCLCKALCSLQLVPSIPFAASLYSALGCCLRKRGPNQQQPESAPRHRSGCRWPQTEISEAQLSQLREAVPAASQARPRAAPASCSTMPYHSCVLEHSRLHPPSASSSLSCVLSLLRSFDLLSLRLSICRSQLRVAVVRVSLLSGRAPS